MIAVAKGARDSSLNGIFWVEKEYIIHIANMKS